VHEQREAVGVMNLRVRYSDEEKKDGEGRHVLYQKKNVLLWNDTLEAAVRGVKS
jgi:hypothetical protein